jgi:hypothetical protein
MTRSLSWVGVEPTYHVIPELVSVRKTFPERKIIMEDWLKLLGWYLAEGNLMRQPNGSACSIHLAQRKPDHRRVIEQLVERIGYSGSVGDNGITINDGQLARHLAVIGSNCLEFRVPDYVRKLSPRLLNLFLDAFVLGDGYRHVNRDVIYTSSPDLASDLHELILKTGVNSTVTRRPIAGQRQWIKDHYATSTADGYVVTRSDIATDMKYKPTNAEEVHYEGFVYCATVPPHHLLYTRRNGRPLWSGNCGVPKSIFDAVDALATNSNARVLAIGNPDDPSSHFAQICKPGSGWHVITVSAFDTPAYTGEKVPEELLPLLVSPEWVEERKVRWGVTSPIYQSKVLGEFPDISDDSLILPRWIEAAQKRTLERTRRPIIAADVARFGEDETVIMRREGGWIRVYRAHDKDDTMTTAGHIAKAMRDIDDEAVKNDWVRAIVDVPGVGGGVVDRLVELELPVVPYNGGEAPIDQERFVNARAEDYWTLRERFEQGEVDIDPDDDKLAAQLGSARSSGASIPWTYQDRIERRYAQARIAVTGPC